MGSGASRQTPVQKEMFIGRLIVPDSEPGYPHPRPPRERKDQVFKLADYGTIDEKSKLAPRSLNNSYTTLLDYLTKDTKNDMAKVRAIFVWLASQRVYDMTYPNVLDAHSPVGYMKTIKQGNGNHATFFALLCRAAGIPCKLVRGIVKGAQYQVGEQDLTRIRSIWNAVYIDGSWRLVHPNWAMTGLIGFDPGTWTKVEENGQAVRQTHQASAGTMVYDMDEFWFLTDPDIFVYYCLADRPEWQLIKSPWNMYKFTNVPHFQDRYFTSGLKLTSEHAAILRSQKGQCEISFEHQESLNVKLDYVLFFDEKNSKDKFPQQLQLDHYVIHSVGKMSKSLVIRFPVVGIYKIDIIAIKNQSNLIICSFRLDCDGCLKKVQPYPLNPEIGFGYSNKAESAGLTRPSQSKGVLVVRQSERVLFNFQRIEKIQLQAVLVHKDKSSSALAPYIKKEESGNNVTIAVTVPGHAQNPEYALQINTRKQGSKAKFENVINYLLTHGNEEIENKKTTTKQSTVDSSEQKNLSLAAEGSDIDRLERAVLEFQDSRLDDHGDLTRAKQKLIALHEEVLRKAIEKRKLNGLELAVQSAKDSCVHFELFQTSTLKEAESLLQLLRRLKHYMHKILELKPATVSEIYSYNRPLPIVHTVMKATYLLLGEREKQLQAWEHVQSLLRKQGREGIIQRIQEFDVIRLKHSIVKRAEAHLNTCVEEEVRLASAGVGPFYVWSRNITREGKRKKLTDD